MKGQSHFTIALIVIMVAAAMLYFVFYSIDQLSQQCKSDSPPEMCQKMTSLTFPVMIILLIVGGFILIICFTVFIILR